MNFAALSHTTASDSHSTLSIHSAPDLNLFPSKKNVNGAPFYSLTPAFTPIIDFGSSLPPVSIGIGSFLSSHHTNVDCTVFVNAQESSRGDENFQIEIDSQDPFLAMVPTRFNGNSNRGEVLIKGPSLFDD